MSESAVAVRPDLGRASVVLSPRQLSDVLLLGTSAFHPLTGFLTSRDYRTVVDDMRLSDGSVWPLPVTLALGPEEAANLREGEPVLLCSEAGRPVASLLVEDLYGYDKRREARLVYRTDDPAHPGVRKVLEQGEILVGGPVSLLREPPGTGQTRHPRYPAETRAAIAARGWQTVVGFQTRNPVHRAHEYIQKCALEICDGLLLHPLVGETKEDDLPAEVRLQSYEVVLDKYYPAARALLALFPAAMRYAGPREAVFHALVRKNYGCTHFIVGRDHAGVGSYYGSYDAQHIFREFAPGELGVTPLFFEHTFYCQACGNMASPKTCPHGPERRISLSGTKVRELLAGGHLLPPEFTRPEVADLLLTHSRKPSEISAPAAPAAPPAPASDASPAVGAPEAVPGFPAVPASPTPAARPARGAVLWFTGLSGAGKSTLSRPLAARLREMGLPVEILDGDEVRENLSKGLGFGREDRETNLKRIAYVARLLARHGVFVITAAISPYRSTRDDIRRETPGFMEVFVSCPLSVCATRDVKGLYRKAMAGEITGFTGVSDPYEEPLAPEVTVETDRETVAGGVEKILAHLSDLGYLSRPAASAGSER